MSSRTRMRVSLALIAFAGLTPGAQAQDPFSEFFGGLFGRRSSAPPPASQSGEPRVRRIMPHRESKTPAYWHRPSEKPRKTVRKPDDATTAPASASETNVVGPPVAQTFFVATMGDTLGILLSNGLAASFEDHPEVGVLRKAKENSGLVRDDYFDWTKAAREIASAPQKPNVAVIMIGSNDRQSIHRGAESFEPLSPQWREIYTARVDAVIAAFKEKNIPLVWVGLPVMKNERFSADMQELNEIYRARVAHAGQTYVDLWESLADEKGQYSAFGPDINGEIVKLRTTDGVHLTEAGARSVAHFVATQVKTFFDGRKAPAPTTATPGKADTPATAPGLAAPVASGQPLVFRPPVNGPVSAPALPDRPAIGPVQPLNASDASGETELAARRTAPPAAPNAAASEALVRHVLVDGGDQPSRPNRADDSSWRAPAAAP